MSADRKNTNISILTMTGMMAAIIFVTNYLRIPFMGTSLHMTNALCVLAGFFFGPLHGFLAAGIGSGFYDIVAGYGAECLITFVSKGAIALLSGAIGYRAAHSARIDRTGRIRIIAGSIIGSLSYVALYMLKTFIFGLTINGLTMDGTIVKMLTKLPGSMINAVFAFIVAPILFHALRPALHYAGLFEFD